MTSAYWFGLATIPALVLSGWAIWQGGRLLNTGLARALRRLPLNNAHDRAMFAAIAAKVRRAHTFSFGDVTVVLALGFNPIAGKPIYDAVYAQLVEPARVNPKWQRKPPDPSVEAAMSAVVDAHREAFHPGRDCRENGRGECADGFSGPEERR